MSAPARRLGKTGPAKTVGAVERPIAWSEVLRVLPDDETRSFALKRFRDAGFTAESFGRSVDAKGAAAEALTRTEDWLETERPRRELERAAIRAVRRRLEEYVR